MPFAENLGTGGGTLDAQYGSAPTVNANAPLLLDHDGTNYAYLPGLSGNYLGVTDSAALDITGDLDVRVLVMLDDWNTGAEQTLSAKFTNLSANRSWQFRIGTTGALQLVTSADGTAILTHTSSVVPTLLSGTAYWLRATIDVASGANRVVEFFSAPFSATTPVAWTQIGSTITTAGTTSIFNSAAPLTLGSINAGLGTFGAGRFYRAQVLSGIGGSVVLDTDLSTMITTGSETAMLSTGPGAPVIPEPLDALPNLGWGGFSLNARYGSAVGPDTNDPLLLTRTTENYVYLPGVTNNYVTVANSPALSITGDIDLRAQVSLPSWTPPTLIGVISKWASNPLANNGSYAFFINSSGQLVASISDGVSNTAFSSTVATGFAANTTNWIRAAIDVDNGAGQSAVTFYTSNDGSTWTQLGTTVTGTLRQKLNVTAVDVRIGHYGLSIDPYPFAGNFYRAQILSGINGTTALDIDFTTGIVNGAQTSLSISGTAADQLDNAFVLTNLGTGGPLLNAQRGSNATAADTNDPQVLSHTGTNYLYLSGVANNVATAPSSAPLNITSDIDLRAYIAMDDWTPSGEGHVVGKYTESGGGYVLSVLTTGTLVLRWVAPGGVNLSATSSVATGLTDGSAKWIRATLDADNGASGYSVVFYLSDDGSTWTQLGTTVTSAGTTSITTTTAALAMGAYATAPSIRLVAGKFYQAQVLNGIGGTVVFDANFTTGITTGAQTTFTESSVNAATVTINRSASGRKSVAVVQPTLLFGTDDYMEVANNDLLNFGAGDSFTILSANRLWNTAPVGGNYFISKKASTSNTSPGWFEWGASNTLNTRSVVSDGTTQITSVSPTATNGSSNAFVSVLNRATNQLTDYRNGVAGTPVSVAAVGSLTNSSVLRIGAIASGAVATDMEFFGAAVWRRALSAAEIATVSGHYAGTVTPASLALLGEAVLWIDAARSKQAAAIARSTSGRKSVAVVRDTLLFGTDDYLEVPDSDLIDFGATDSFTVAAVVRQWATPINNAIYINKRDALAPNIGYRMQASGTALQYGAAIDDGPTVASPSPLSVGAGSLSSLGLVVNRSTQEVTTFNGSSVSPPVSIATIGSLANTVPFQIGATPSQDFEFFGAAVFRRALTAAEIATVNDHYQTGPTTASTALLRQAVLWLDPSQRSAMTLNRASSGRRSVAVPTAVWSLATDDYFEVPDSVLLDMGVGQDFTALVIQRPWWLQGSSDTLVAKVDTTTVTAQGWAVSNPTTGDALRTAGRIGDGSAGAEAFGPQRLHGQRQAVVLVRSGGTLTAWTGGTAGTPVAATTGDLSNGSVMRIGRLSGAGAEYLDSEIRAVAVWRRALSTAEITAVINYYGAA